MNICYPGNCICDAREWEGDTNCMGEIHCGSCNREHKPGPCSQSLPTDPRGNVPPQYLGGGHRMHPGATKREE